MKKKLIIIVGILIVCSIFINCLFINNEKEPYILGRNHHCFLFNIVDNTVYFKDDVLVNDTYEFKGLYKKDAGTSSQDSGELLYDKYYSCVNYYKGALYFIDIEHNIMKLDLNTKEVGSIVESGENSVKNLLIIDNLMYYLQGDKDDNFILFAYDLKTNDTVQIAEQVYWLYLFNYGNAICTLSENKDKINVWDPDTDELKQYDSFEFEVLQIWDDSSVLCYGNDRLYLYKDIEAEEYEEIVHSENIISVIVRKTNILISTLDEYGMIEVFLYSTPNKTIRKIANADYVPREFNDQFILCGSDSGVGEIQLIDIETGKISTFAQH